MTKLPLFALALVGTAALLAGAAQAQVADGAYCREYTQTIKIGGKVQHAYGTACQQPDGSWQTESGQEISDVVQAPPAPPPAPRAYVVDEAPAPVYAAAPPVVFGTVFIGDGHYYRGHGWHRGYYHHGWH